MDNIIDPTTLEPNTQALLQRLRFRQTLICALRDFFYTQDFIEVDTPILQTAPAPEPQIEALQVSVYYQQKKNVRYLQTSPELPMKRLLCEGANKIFQIAPTFRDDDFSPIHRPEFRMLEWYRRNGTWHDLINDCQFLLRALQKATQKTLNFGRLQISFDAPLPQIRVEDAFRRYAGFSILENLNIETLRTTLEQKGVHFSNTDSWDDLYHRIYVARVEPQLVANYPAFFLTHFPRPLASLARLDPTDTRVAERVELYVRGMELANGFGELTNSQEQRQRFLNDKKKRQELGKHDYPIDERFLQSLFRLPAACGMALGVDRLLMLWMQENDLRNVSAVAWEET